MKKITDFADSPKYGSRKHGRSLILESKFMKVRPYRFKLIIK